MRLRDETGTYDDDGAPPPPPNGTRPGNDAPDYTSLFNAPNYTDLVRPAQTRGAKEYSDKVKSCLKAVMIDSINVGDFPDAAAILAYGPGFADAAGQFADSNKYAAQAVDIITSPSNPAAMFIMTGIPLLAQVFRNHEEGIKRLPETRRQMRLRRKAMRDAEKAQPPRFTIRFLGRQWPVRFKTPRLSRYTAGVMANTRDPEQLTLNVFTDPTVVRALKKQGIILVKQDADTR